MLVSFRNNRGQAPFICLASCAAAALRVVRGIGVDGDLDQFVDVASAAKAMEPRLPRPDVLLEDVAGAVARLDEAVIVVVEPIGVFPVAHHVGGGAVVPGDLDGASSEAIVFEYTRKAQAFKPNPSLSQLRVKPPRPKGRGFQRQKRRNPPKPLAGHAGGPEETDAPFLPAPRDGASGRRRVKTIADERGLTSSHSKGVRSKGATVSDASPLLS